MQNAHLRMGKLKFVRQTRDTITEVSLHMDRLVAEKPTDPRTAVQIHLVSVFGGDQEIGAIAAAVSDGQRFEVSLPDDGPELLGSLGEKPVSYRASIQVPGRKRPVRHLVVISQTLFETTLGSDGQARRTVLPTVSPVSRCTGWRCASVCQPFLNGPIGSAGNSTVADWWKNFWDSTARRWRSRAPSSGCSESSARA